MQTGRRASREGAKPRSTTEPGPERPGATTAGPQQPHPATLVQRAVQLPAALAPRDLLHLQRAIGNQAVGRLLSRPAATGAGGRVQRFVDPAVTGPLGPGSTRDQIYAIYQAQVWPSYVRVRELLEAHTELPAQNRALHTAWQAFADATTTTDGRPTSPLKLGAAQALTALNHLVTAVNTAEEVVNKTPLPPEAAQGAVAGTEFTFTRDDLHGLDTNKRDSVMLAAEGVIKGWKLASGAYKEVPLSQPGKSPAARKFVYQIPSLQREWWWVLDIDDACIETQTAPTSIRDLQANDEIKHIIDKDIFGGAKAQELAPHEMIGGGHLSLDRGTTFGESGVAFRNFVVQYANLADTWRELDRDFINAPLVQELPVPQRTEFVKVIQEFDAAYAGPVRDQWTLDRLVNELSGRVFTFVRTVQQIGNPLHYQAINVEHMGDANPASRRVEMRRFPAQQSLADLLWGHLQALVELIQASRDTNLIPLKPIDTASRNNADQIVRVGPVDTKAIKDAQDKIRQDLTPSQKEQREMEKADLLEKP